MSETTLEVIFKGKDELTGVAKNISGTFGGIGKSIAGGLAIGATAIAGLGVGAIAVGSQLVGLGSDANETASLIEASLGSSTDSYNNRLKEFATNANRSFFELQQGSSTIVAMTKSMGASEQQAADFGVTFGIMASDLGSFFNQADSQVLLDIQSALSGSSETMQKYGIDVKEGTLKQMALNQGLIETASDTLPALVRAQLVQQAITEQASDAMGDAIRTSDGWANQTRGLKAMLTDTATEMGQKLIPAIKPFLEAAMNLGRALLPLVIAAFEKLIPFVQMAAEWVNNLVAETIAGEGPLVAIGEKIIEIKDRIVEFLAPVIDWIKNNVELQDVLTALAIVLGGVVLAAIVAIAQAIGPVILAITALIAIVVGVRKAWEALQPAMEKIRAFFTDKVFPVFKMLMDVYLFPIRLAFEGLKITINNVLEAVRRLTLGLIDIDVPDWLKPGSPTPFEIGLKGIRGELQDLYRQDLPALNTGLQGLQTTNNRNTTLNQTTNIYTSRVDTRGESDSARRFVLGGI